MVAKLLISCALACEAKPLIEHYKLQVIQQQPFKVYQDKAQSLYVIISGIGKYNAAAAVSFLFALSGQHTHSVFLNLGIGGCATADIGELFFGNKIIDIITKTAAYPNPHCFKGIVGLPIITYHQAQEQLLPDVIVDMEASSFFSIAKRCVSYDQIHVLKIISDNAAQSYEHLTAAIIQGLVQAQLNTLISLIDHLLHVSQHESLQQMDLTVFHELIKRCHFTVSQQRQLKPLLRRWQVQLPNATMPHDLTTAKRILDYLTSELSHAHHLY